MASTVLLLVADNAYLPHAKALLVNAVRQGNWKHDLCLLCPQDCDTASIQERGIKVCVAPEQHWTNAIKFRIFASVFRRWQRLLYLDCDVLIQGDLSQACDDMAQRFPSLLCDGTQALPPPSGTTILQDWQHFDRLSTGTQHPEVYARMRERFPHIDEPLFVSAAMFFDPTTIPQDTTEMLFAAQADFAEANPRCYDQQVMNLVLYDRMATMGKDYVTWWAFDEPASRVASAERDWRGDEAPVILHYWSAFAPWIVKQSGAGAYYNYRLGRVCHELYAENLAAFDETFPQRKD